MFSKKNRPASQIDKPVTTAKGSLPAGVRADKPATREPQPCVVPAPVVVVAASPAAPVTAAAVAPALPAVLPATVQPAAAPVAPPARERSAIIALITKLRDADADTARDAATTLGNLSVDTEAVMALATVVQNQAGYFHAVVRAAAAEALGKLGDRRALDALLHATQDTMAEASHQAIGALGRLGDPRALPVLEAIVRNENGFFLDYIRQAATSASAAIKKATPATKI